MDLALDHRVGNALMEETQADQVRNASAELGITLKLVLYHRRLEGRRMSHKQCQLRCHGS